MFWSVYLNVVRETMHGLTTLYKAERQVKAFLLLDFGSDEAEILKSMQNAFADVNTAIAGLKSANSVLASQIDKLGKKH